MRRSLIVAGTMLAVLLATTSAKAAGNSFHFKATGPGAEAFWTTFPADGNPVPNVVYTDTFLFTADNAVVENGESYQDKFLFIDQFTYKFDKKGNFISLSETFGFAGGSDVSLSVDAKKLTAASVTATVSLTTCTNRSCSDAGTASVSASWTGNGDIVRSSDNFHAVSKSFTESGHFRGVFRGATATGSFAGEDLGTSLFADIFNVTQSDVFICHGC